MKNKLWTLQPYDVMLLFQDSGRKYCVLTGWWVDCRGLNPNYLHAPLWLANNSTTAAILLNFHAEELQTSSQASSSKTSIYVVPEYPATMAVEGKMSVIKYLMFFFNFLFWVSMFWLHFSHSSAKEWRRWTGLFTFLIVAIKYSSIPRWLVSSGFQ